MLIPLILVVAGVCWINSALKPTFLPQHWAITCLRAFAGVGLLFLGVYLGRGF